MAAFNKAKAVENAQKFLNQGKIPQAIAEYLIVHKHDPKDQITLMTIGDLYVRTGDNTQGVSYFEKLASLFMSDGFVTKSIAIYKKIVKLAPDRAEILEKLAELYVQQGIMSEARPIYLQMAEAHLKSNRTQPAIEILRKLLDLEPDNQRVQLRLAELYVNIGQGKEAATAFLNAAHRLLDKGDFLEAEKMADRALKADAKNAHASTLKARALAALGNPDAAVKLLEGLSGTPGSDSLSLLVELYLQSGKSARAVALARKAFEAGPDQYAVVLDVARALFDGGESEPAMGLLTEIRETMLAAGDYERLAQILATAVDRLPGRLEPLEWQADLFRRMSDAFRLPEALDQLAEAAVSAGRFDLAQKTFEELLTHNPEDQNTKQRLDQVRQKMGLAPAFGGAPVVAEGAEFPVPFAEELVATPASEEAQLDDETQAYVSQALTDVDLFASYGMNQKAVDLLETVIQRVPRHTTVLEKLLDLYLGAGNERRTAELASQLEQIYTQQGDDKNADRFSQLRRRFQRAAGMGAEEIAEMAATPPPPAEFMIPLEQAQAAPAVEAEAVEEVPAQPQGQAEVHEVDLSDEWASLSTQVSEPPPTPPPPAEIAAAPEEGSVQEIQWEQPAEAAPAAPAEEEISLEVVEEEAPAKKAPVPAEEAVDYELAQAPAGDAAHADAGGAMSSDQFLADLADEVDKLDLIPAAPAGRGPAAPRAPAAPGAGKPDESVAQLREVFEEFRAELGEMGEEVEDLETHYNLGIAYREMGLLDEGIGEFQKVAKLIQAGRPFRYAMQCYTLLGLCFIGKGQPNISAVWYQRALSIPGLDQESQLALRYDLGLAQEQAGDVPAALASFSQVYAVNIDYRDVSERIAALQKRR